MKILFALIVLCISFAAIAQQPRVYKLPLQNPKDWERQSYRDSMMKRIDIVSTPVGTQARFSHMLPNGSAVYMLPQDNMPCIVPPAANYSMPVMRGNTMSTMPNLINPYPLIPRRDSLQ